MRRGLRRGGGPEPLPAGRGQEEEEEAGRRKGGRRRWREAGAARGAEGPPLDTGQEPSESNFLGRAPEQEN